MATIRSTWRSPTRKIAPADLALRRSLPKNCSLSDSTFSLAETIASTNAKYLEYLNTQPRLLRPANYPNGLPGGGVFTGNTSKGIPYAVLNLQGRAHMSNIDCPFRKADQLLGSLDPDIRIRFVDFHAELTSEKIAMGWYLDGRATAMIGTHTHIPTADARVLPGGLAYQTDAGMTGPYDSVIGVEKETVIKRFLSGLAGRMEAARHGIELHGVVIDADETTGRARSIQRVHCVK